MYSLVHINNGQPYNMRIRRTIFTIQKWTVDKMFKTAESFYVSLGLDKMVDTFWTKSMFVRPEVGEVICHAYAFDFYDKHDFR